MTLQGLIEKFHDSEDRPQEIRRTAWQVEDQHLKRCFWSDGCFYTSREFDYHFPFDNQDLTASDWEYLKPVWKSK